MKLKVEFWVSITAMITAIVAVFVAVIQTQVMKDEAEMEREHARLSVLPVLSISDRSNIGDKTGRFSITIVNKGLGPAVIEKFERSVDGKVVDSWAEYASLLTGGKVKLDGDKRNIGSISTATINAGTIISDGDSISPIEVEGRTELVKSLLSDEHQGKVTICFCSLYKECWLADSTKARPEPKNSCD